MARRNTRANCEMMSVREDTGSSSNGLNVTINVEKLATLLIEELSKRNYQLQNNTDDESVQKRTNSRSSSKGRVTRRSISKLADEARSHSLRNCGNCKTMTKNAVENRRMTRAVSEGRTLHTPSIAEEAFQKSGKMRNLRSRSHRMSEVSVFNTNYCSRCLNSWKRKDGRALNYTFQRYDYIENKPDA